MFLLILNFVIYINLFDAAAIWRIELLHGIHVDCRYSFIDLTPFSIM